MHSQERLGKTSQSICQIPLQADFGLNPILFGAIVACMGCPRRGESPALTPSPNSHPTKHNDTESIPARGCISPRSRAEPHQDHPWCFASPGTTWAPCSPSDPPVPVLVRTKGRGTPCRHASSQHILSGTCRKRR